MIAMATSNLLPAVVDSHERAETTIAALQHAGYTEDEIGVPLIEHGHYKVLDEETHEVLSGLSKGVAVGGPAGASSGTALLTALIPGMGSITARTATWP